VARGDHEGRRLWHDLWLTSAAMGMSKRDLAKFGIEELDQLDKPIPPGILILARVVVRQNDQGKEYNHISHFEYHGVDPGDPFAPEEEGQTSRQGTLFDSPPTINGPYRGDRF